MSQQPRICIAEQFHLTSHDRVFFDIALGGTCLPRCTPAKVTPTHNNQANPSAASPSSSSTTSAPRRQRTSASSARARPRAPTAGRRATRAPSSTASCVPLSSLLLVTSKIWDMKHDRDILTRNRLPTSSARAATSSTATGPARRRSGATRPLRTRTSP